MDINPSEVVTSQASHHHYPQEEVRQPVSFFWPRCCTPPVLESMGFSFTEFNYSFTFPAPCFYFCPLPMSLHHQVALPQCQQGREWEQPCVNQMPGPWAAGVLQEQCDLFPFLGNPAHHLCHVLKLHWSKAWDESSRGESSGGRAKMRCG